MWWDCPYLPGGCNKRLHSRCCAKDSAKSANREDNYVVNIIRQDCWWGCSSMFMPHFSIYLAANSRWWHLDFSRICSESPAEKHQAWHGESSCSQHATIPTPLTSTESTARQDLETAAYFPGGRPLSNSASTCHSFSSRSTQWLGPFLSGLFTSMKP